MLRFSTFVVLLSLLLSSSSRAGQTTTPTARIARVTITGLRTLAPEPFLEITGLPAGKSASKEDLQAAADRLLQLGLFSKIAYEYRSFADGWVVTFHAEEAPRVPVLFDNMPTVDDTEIIAALRATLPYFDGTAPESGSVLDSIGNALQQFLQSRNINAAIEHQLVPNPFGEGALQQYRAIGTDSRIASVEFSDALISSSRQLPGDLAALLGKPFSRLAIQIFLAEKVQPFYLQHGYLRVRFGVPQIRLSGPPVRKLPEALPVFIPVTTGVAYHWRGVEWSGNSVLASAALDEQMGQKIGGVAEGQEIDLGWERVKEEYGRHGYLRAKLSPEPRYDDASAGVSYRVAIEEENQYRYGELVLTGLSLSGEEKVRSAWPMRPGDIFDKTKYEGFLEKLQDHSSAIFGKMPVTFDKVGHWLDIHAENKTVSVLLDFK